MIPPTPSTRTVAPIRSGATSWTLRSKKSRVRNPVCMPSTIKETGRPKAPRIEPARCASLHRIVHVELDRVRRLVEADDLLHLQLDVGIDHVVGEHVAGLEEGAVLVEVGEGFAERSADRRDLLQFLRRQVVEVLVHRLAGM